MKTRLFLSALPGFATLFLVSGASAADLTAVFDAKHKACLERIAEDADLAFEEAMIWRGEGGGRRAKHCEAMALFAVGHKEEAAHRLDKLAQAPDGGTKEMRADFYAEASNFWLLSGEQKKAYRSATDGLDLVENHTDLRIARARSYALMERYDWAEADLSNALAYAPNEPRALRYRADARRKQGKLQDARTDIERALRADPNSVETALVRGEIIEAIRLSNLKTE